MNIDKAKEIATDKLYDAAHEVADVVTDEDYTKPYNFDNKSWHMDAADFLLPEGEEGMAELGRACGSALLCEHPSLPCETSYHYAKIGKLIVEALKANRVTWQMLEEVKPS